MLSKPRPNPWANPRPWLLLFICLGIAWRLLDLCLNFPLFSDEAAVALNLLDRSYAGLLKPLEFSQVAPRGFLFIEKWTLLHLGPQEWALRLPALLFGLACFPLLHRAARAYGSRYAPLVATALLAISLNTVRFAVMLKPYSLDFLAAAILTWIGARLLRNPSRPLSTRVAALTLLAPLLLLFSYPAVFVVAALGLATLPRVMRRGTISSRLVYLLGFALAIGTFLAIYLLIGRQQPAATRAGMESFWHDEFLPFNRSLPWWLLRAHLTGMMSYPFAGKYGIAFLVFPLTLLGAFRIWRRNSPAHALLLLLPFAFTLLASAFHLYPYGGHARVEQHLAPAIFILASHGLLLSLASILWTLGVLRAATARVIRAALVQYLPLSLAAIFILYIGYALVGMVLDIHRPYTSAGARQVRQIARRIFTPSLPADAPVVVYTHARIPWTMLYYFRAQPHLRSPRGHLLLYKPLAELWTPPHPGNCLWLVALHPHRPDVLAPVLAKLQSYRPFKAAYHRNKRLLEGIAGLPLDFCELLFLKAPQHESPPACLPLVQGDTTTPDRPSRPAPSPLR